MATIDFPAKPPTLTRNQIRKVARLYKDQIPLDSPPITLRVCVSTIVIVLFLGQEWFQKNLGVEPTTFFLQPPNSEVRVEVLIRRVCELGDMLFNLQHTPGFQHALKKLQKDNVETGFAALEVGKLLKLSQTRFRFVAEQGQKGADYDLEIFTNTGQTVCGEVKCKLESTSPSEASMWNSLVVARKQLPKDQLGVIFVRVPREWLGDDYQGMPFAQVASKFLQRTSRVALIVIYGNVFLSSGELRQTMMLAKNIYSPLQNHLRAKDWKLIATKIYHSVFGEPWISLGTILSFDWPKHSPADGE